jgi:hypothetical protein
MKAFVEQLNTAGYAVIRGFLSAAETATISSEVDRIYAQGLQHHATYRDRNLLFEILDDPKARRRVVLQAHWAAWISPLMESMRRTRFIGSRREQNTPLTGSIRTRAFGPVT